MKPSDVKDAIVDYLENIVNRINYINHHHPGKDLSLDIDLVKDDIRMLYGKLELLKSMALPEKIIVKDEPVPTDDRPVKNTPADDHVHQKKEQSITHIEQEKKQTEQPANKPPGQQEIHDISQQQATDDQVDQQPEHTLEIFIPDDDTSNDSIANEFQQEKTIEDKSAQDETVSNTNVPIPQSFETAKESDDAPETDTLSGNTDAGETASAEVTESASETPSRPETNQHTEKADLQYRQSGLDFSDNAATPSQSEASEQKYDAAEVYNKQTENNNSNNNFRDKGKKTVIDLLSANKEKAVADQYVEADNSLNKRISANTTDKSIGARMQQKPISNIKEVIGVNEKFLFINELFDGDIQEYHDAISRLNSMQHMQEAFDFLNELSEQYSWDANRSAATIEKLANYVQRRYM